MADQLPVESGKKPWLSKSVWLGLLTAVAPFIPGVGEFVSKNLEMIGMIWGALAVVLRLVTKDKISLVD